MIEERITTSLALPRSALALLRVAAAERASRRGGRVSVSAVVAELVEAHRAELVREPQDHEGARA